MSVLLVEDDLQLGAALQRVMELEAIDSHWVSRLAAARATLLRQTPSLILLDLNLQDGDGLELFKELRAAGNHTPIIIMTARDIRATHIDDFDARIDSFVLKPFFIADLLVRVREILSAQP